LTILGGLISGLIGLLLERKRRKDQVLAKHFEEIKKDVLQPIIERHKYDDLQFELREDTVSYDSLYKQLGQDIHWWDYFSLRSGADNVLYEDLHNHFKDLTEKILQFEQAIKSNTPIFLKRLCDISKMISEDEECKSLVSVEVITPGMDPIWKYVQAILLVAMGYDKGVWPNLFNEIKNEGKIEAVYKIGIKYRETKEIEQILSIKRDTQEKIRSCIGEAKDIMHQSKLKGDCKYLKI
jgi:hypothetical protein